jgi:hypothetical protein
MSIEETNAATEIVITVFLFINQLVEYVTGWGNGGGTE